MFNFKKHGIMKKTYIEPTTRIVKINAGSAMLSTSKMVVGDDMTSGSAASREGGRSISWDDEEE